MVTIGNAMGATIPVAFGQTRCNVLIDTGAMKSCMSQTFYQQLMLPTMRSIYTYQMKSATGSNLCPMGITGCEFKIGDKSYRTDFVVCKNLTRPCILGQDIPFEWTMQCQAAFEMLKEAIITSPILKYPDPNKGYTLFTDASKYAWACVLTQEYQYEKDGKEYRINHPITFASGLFKGSQMNWAALTKEAFAIYSSIKKLSYYLEDAQIILKSDHLPLKKFLQKNTLNSKVNNWAVEIYPYRIKFEYIKGIKNTLADTMSRLIQIDPEAKLQPEQEGYEFGYHAFEDMEPIEYEANVVDSTSSKDPIPLPGEEIKLPLEDEVTSAKR